MRILMISAEGPPLQRTGALIDVMDALPTALRAQGHDVCVVLPFYREIRENRAFKTKNTGIAVDVQIGDRVYCARYLEGRSAAGQSCTCRICICGVSRRDNSSAALQKKINRAALSS